MARNPARFSFDGETAGYLGTVVMAGVVTLVTLGFGFPLGLVRVQRWKARHTTVEGRRLVFTGSARELTGDWVPWWLLTLGTLGLYGFCVKPRVTRWVWANTDYEPGPTGSKSHAGEPRQLGDPSRLHLAFSSEAGRHRLVL